MTAHNTHDYVRENAHIGMPITTSKYGNILAVLVGIVINQFSLGSKLVGITSDGGTNLARCKAVLEINFDNTGVFDLGKPIFVMECISRFLDNACKEVIMDVKYY